MWATDATSTTTPAEGTVTVFVLIDHHTLECLGLHAPKPGTRFEALEPIRQGVRRVFGGFAADIAAGAQLRHHHRPQNINDPFQPEIAFPPTDTESQLPARRRAATSPSGSCTC